MTIVLIRIITKIIQLLFTTDGLLYNVKLTYIAAFVLGHDSLNPRKCNTEVDKTMFYDVCVHKSDRLDVRMLDFFLMCSARSE